METGALKVSPSLDELLRRAAAHRGKSVSEFCRIVRRGILRNRPVVQREIDEVYNQPCLALLRIRNFELPRNCSESEFRRQLALRCLEELGKPADPPAPVFEAVEGKDYIVEAMEE